MKIQFLSLSLALLLLSQTVMIPGAYATEAPPNTDQTESAVSGEIPPENTAIVQGAMQSVTSSQVTDTPDLLNNPANITYSKEISDAGLELIKSFEGFTAYPIWDYKQYSYGYGSHCDASTVYADPDSPTGYSTTLYPDGIPEREAEKLLKEMVDRFNTYLNKMLEEHKIVLNQNQFDALASFGYNLGPSCWSKTDHSLRNAIVSGDYTEESLTEIFGRYCHAGGNRLEGLYQRRMREAAIFFSPYSMSDPDADLYVVNTTSNLTIREEPSRSSASKGQVKASKVIRVHEYSADGKWAYTSYCGYYGWVDKSYLISIHEDTMVSKVDSNRRDEAGLTYTFDPLTMTAMLGGRGSTNSSGYAGSYAGEVYLTPQILYDGAIYRLTAISDSAFTDCDTIRTICIPESITSIGANAFAGSSLQIIYYTDGSYAKEYAKASAFTATDLRCKDSHTATEWTVIIEGSDVNARTEGQQCSVCKEKLIRYHVAIEITSFPNKTEYKLGNAFQEKGLALQAVYSDGTTVPIQGYTLSGYDPNRTGTQTITVTYSLFTAKFTVKVSERQLDGIAISAKPKQLTYIEGQAIDYTGLSVKAVYDDNTSNAITEYAISGYDPNKVGKQTITVTYNGKTATFTVTVKAKSLTKVQILEYPDTMEYFCGDKFDPTGLTLKLVYDNGTTETVESGFKISGYNSSTPGKQSVKVTYGKKSATIHITVILNYLRTDALQIDNGYIQPIQAGITVAELREYFESGDRIEVLRGEHPLADTATVTTDCIVRLIYNGEVQDSAILLVAGDLTGDGKCQFTDFLMVGDYLMGKLEFSPQAMLIADLNKDGTVTLADYYALYQLTQTEPPADIV